MSVQRGLIIGFTWLAAHWLPYRQDGTVADEVTVPSMIYVVIYGNCVSISVSQSVHLKCTCHFMVKLGVELGLNPLKPIYLCYAMVKLGRSGSFRVRVGVKTSIVTDTENETVLTSL